MTNICTIADDNFRLRFLAMRESIVRHNSKYNLNLLCLDDSIYEFISKKCSDVNCYRIEDLVKEDPELSAARDNNPSREALNVSKGNIEDAKRLQFIWALASYFSWYCLKKLNLSDILYVDADIYFFNSMEYIEELKFLGSIGLIENRIPDTSVNGRFNVGIIYFKNDIQGLSCCEFWKKCLLNPGNEYYNEYGACGDQKYLELFDKLYEDVFIFDDYIGHLAPWSLPYHKFIGNKAMWNGKFQDIIFFHFSNFDYNFEEGTYIPARRHNIVALPHNSTPHQMYEEYYKCLEGLNEDSI
tara:strand:- start:243 stop:1139 length:897 start_codon:yes stop_codon:yes gene_type:complete